jgi:hypothetical protein
VTYEEFLDYALEYAAEHPEQRLGQAFCNALHYFAPDVREVIMNTDADPFYEEAALGPRMKAFHAAVMKELSH